MKTIINILFLLVVSLTLQAQTSTKTALVNVNKITGEPVTTVDNLTFNATDTLGLRDSTYSIVFPVDFNKAFTYNYRVKIDSVSGTANNTVVKLRGKVWSEDAYSDITTVTYKGTGIDTTITIATATAVRYRYMDLFIENNAGKVKISKAKAKYWY